MKSYINIITKNALKINLNDFNLDNRTKIQKSRVFKCKCDYCKKDIFIVFDDIISADGYSIYQGIQAQKNNIYKYSSIVNEIRKGNLNFSINDLCNSHTRIHSDNKDDLDLRFSKLCFRRLCNKCFRKTFNRIKVLDKNTNITYAISLINDPGINKNENIKDALEEFKDIIKNPIILDKGSINNY